MRAAGAPGGGRGTWAGAPVLASASRATFFFCFFGRPQVKDQGGWRPCQCHALMRDVSSAAHGARTVPCSDALCCRGLWRCGRTDAHAGRRGSGAGRVRAAVSVAGTRILSGLGFGGFIVGASPHFVRFRSRMQAEQWMLVLLVGLGVCWVDWGGLPTCGSASACYISRPCYTWRYARGRR